MNADSELPGEIRQIFKPKLANIVAGFIIGLLLILGGISAALFMILRTDPRPLSPSDQIAKYFLIGVLGLGAPSGGIALLVWMKQLARHRVLVYDEGFVYLYGGVEEACRWLEVEKICEVLTEEELKLLKIPGASITKIDRSMVVHRKDGKEFSFTVNSIDNVPLLTGYLEEASEQHNIPWEQIKQ